MNEKELRIAKISQLLNTAILSKNSVDYNKALSLLEHSEKKPSLKEILDAQVAENKRIKEENRLKEELEDKMRLDKARKSLESEERKKNSKKQETSQILKESWNENLNLKELQKELADLRLNNEDYEEIEYKEKTQEEIEEEEERKLQEVIKRYEKMFGRIKGIDTKRSQAGSIAGKSIVSSKPLSKKSKVSEFSTVSQREAYEKLKQLDEEEDRIKKEKEDLMKFLELRSQSSKASYSRPTTVGSLVKHVAEKKNLEEKIPSLSVIPEDEKEKKKEKHEKIEKKTKNDFKGRSEDLDELFKNLY